MLIPGSSFFPLAFPPDMSMPCICAASAPCALAASCAQAHHGINRTTPANPLSPLMPSLSIL